ncbi:hypothetical protein FWJ25_06925 [Marinobacter salinexigens]|uniref:Type II secretion system protein GspB C-terminal domain-containing protein n=1 Tax=Marinobacter salinexigens TaxID=2919747 RepID=A0A5B0VL74_9GAMM|nr:general secretion pathway protein GspB [Marinobacter salinexigens]KAA1175093.1 hypothetical protein FWJ25_06925 [Marinobacter salinexigens]
MSYILDALRKSETERRQGKVPDLGQQVQLIHRPKKKGISPAVWIALALVVNAAVLAVIFWPGDSAGRKVAAVPSGGAAEVQESSVPVVPGQSQEETVAPESAPDLDVPGDPEAPAADPAVSESGRNELVEPVREKATIIVPSAASNDESTQTPEPEFSERVPHLVELPLSFQKSIPDLTFNSHLYASDPSARRVMINDRYLRTGDRFDGLLVERITEEGVVLSKQGQRFRVGIVRDWVSPR